MEDYVSTELKQANDSALGLFAIFNGHLSHVVPDHLSVLFVVLTKRLYFFSRGQPDFWTEPENKLVVANVGYSLAVISKNGVAKQLSVDHEPASERESIENRGGLVLNFPGDVLEHW
ncbi:hypothetical protein J1N35_028494 [Gossypium stocksii]|uniref:PPM-type phosphatase domain-containing protein n=1 Tax=Gossypium stocksii TaxID=47602 RepID=A0A9D3UWE5_9ROSI|nr:hypothetical protein J1N35_028494 [Gossypium stocksii]